MALLSFGSILLDEASLFFDSPDSVRVYACII